MARTILSALGISKKYALTDTGFSISGVRVEAVPHIYRAKKSINAHARDHVRGRVRRVPLPVVQ